MKLFYRKPVPIIEKAEKIKKAAKKIKLIEPIEPKIDLEICVQMYGFQRRCWWQLSSIIDQCQYENNPVPKIRMRVNVHKKDPFAHMTEKIDKTFSSLMDLVLIEWDTQDFFYRGITRDRDLKETKAKWLLFTDVDTAFEPTFFSQLFDKIETDWKDVGVPIGTGRYQLLPIEKANQLVDTEKYDRPIKNAFSKSYELAKQNRRGKAGAYGSFQLVNVANIKPQNISYAGGDVPISDNHSGSFRSDRKFRNQFKNVISSNNLPKSVHIQHYRKQNALFQKDECL